MNRTTPPDPAYDMTFYNDYVSGFGYYGIDLEGEYAQQTRGDMTVHSGAVPNGLLTGQPAWYAWYYDYPPQVDTWPIQFGYHKEAHGTTGSYVIKFAKDGSSSALSRTFTFICKTDGDWCTFDYGPFVQNGATPDPLYDHVWKDGTATLNVIPESLSTRLVNRRYRVTAGSLPVGVSLDESNGQLSMNGSVLSGAATGSYKIQLADSGRGVRDMTYTWKREGLAGP